ncbi:toll/interleukin-1 receptor domain-containing protein [Frigidibacter sp.]|uniref:toll/interleukin-1 receptor domain-containing protein n=1 Tax=Frigidibacter sp. TaxID=2586418 RepID=UPI0027329377|nr:toll/interleukin-1 receptor domain-containing protein [Frigidibacter sp.]MDP3340780.1 toll/interleukin-1 receptor domain-containing protein [Frigidibacter sp.]
MSDVYVIHSSEDGEATRIIVEFLSSHWTIWWDDTLVGDFSTVIQEKMSCTKFVVAVLSAHAIKKETVIDEMRLAKEAGVTLLPVMLDASSPPYPYGGLSRVSLAEWDETEAHADFQKIIRKISSVVPRRVPPSRPMEVLRTSLSLPAVFLSVSSHETQLVPLEAIKVLRVFGAPAVLVSAYDLWAKRRPKAAASELNAIREAGGVVIVDSGNYEASRRRSRNWTPQKFHEALQGIPHDWAYCFDVMRPSQSLKDAVTEVVDAVNRDSKATGSMVLPIVHTFREPAGYDSRQLPEVVKLVASELQPPLIAVAERELGRGLIERADTVRKIRRSLDNLPFYQPLHVLGTGNPWSIALLAAAGADSFDGLEWCRMAFDHQMHRLNHYQHFDFFTFQTELSESAVALKALESKDIGYTGKVAFHNLEYYRRYAKDLRDYAHTNRMEAFIMKIMGDGATNQISVALPGIFVR